MNPKTDITESQWLAAFEAARQKVPKGGKTIFEVRQLVGHPGPPVSEKTALRYLRMVGAVRTAVGKYVYWTLPDAKKP